MPTPSTDSVWCAIPVYNNGATVRAVAEGCRRHVAQVLVVDDGSTDVDIARLFAGSGIEVLAHPRNLGKGSALLSALAHIRDRGGQWMVCLDADGQHDPDDLPAFFPQLVDPPRHIVVGARDFGVPNVPAGSRFGRRFSNFWVKLECGAALSDTQSGFRAYPVGLVSQIAFRGRRFDFEVEVLAKAVWQGLGVAEVPVRVFYAPKGERISHFNQWKDNLLLTHRHGMLVARRLLPWPHRKLVAPGPSDWRTLLRHPRRFLAMLLKENSTPAELGAAAGVGIVLATLPLVACHTIAILYVTTKLNLNRLLAVNVQHLCAPPFVPLACIWLGFFLRNGHWIGRAELRTAAADLHQHLLNWLLGSLALAPLFGLAAGLATYRIASTVRRKGVRQHA